MGLHCPGRARWDDTSVSQTPIKPDGKTDRGIIDRQEKGRLPPLSLIIEKENQRESSREEAMEQEESSNNL